ncbi:hypothetical protein HAX54_045790 [Datura stramonium]|uniref:Uncharacterized protein n=1 Tax=Datura stramonium TaxID=4076 RepID=A0ABS8WK39_DATST|nr:hypothetical protein [Datura stramonium]
MAKMVSRRHGFGGEVLRSHGGYGVSPACWRRGRCGGLVGRRRPGDRGEKKKVVCMELSGWYLPTAVSGGEREKRGGRLGLVFSGQAVAETMVEADDKESKEGLWRGGKMKVGDGVSGDGGRREIAKRKRRAGGDALWLHVR